jgi:hypothetical protein
MKSCTLRETLKRGAGVEHELHDFDPWKTKVSLGVRLIQYKLSLFANEILKGEEGKGGGLKRRGGGWAG